MLIGDELVLVILAQSLGILFWLFSELKCSEKYQFFVMSWQNNDGNLQIQVKVLAQKFMAKITQVM